jgi:hypothetical protein
MFKYSLYALGKIVFMFVISYECLFPDLFFILWFLYVLLCGIK